MRRHPPERRTPVNRGAETDAALKIYSKDTAFFDILERQAAMAHEAACALQMMVRDFPNRAAYAERIDKMESEADNLAHQLANKVDATFVTPLDKEDLHEFSQKLDDIMDFIDSCAARIIMYQIPEPREDLEPLVAILVEITESSCIAVGCLRKLKQKDFIHDIIVRIHELENRADRGFRGALSHLFNAPDAVPLDVMKWKEVYDRIELAVDQCEDVANLVESAAVKYG